ncbi:MAG: UDP-N-acetylmuramate--L-alanine ligase [bacterium]
MIGIKGVGMTMLAQFLAENGCEISGSDVEEKFMTDEVLAKVGIKVIEKFDKNNIPGNVDLIIYSTGYNKETNEEVAVALKKKIKVLTYAEALAEIFNSQYGIAVVGSHGKTTTTAWLGYVLDRAGISPNVLVGARVPQFEGLSLVGKSDYFISEVDEYQNKLQFFHPQAVILNNIDYDHPDFFPDEKSYCDVFIEFIKKIPKKGFLIANFDDANTRKIAWVNCHGRVITYAINETADYVAYDIKSDAGRQYFKVKFGVSDLDEDEGEKDFKDEDLGDFCIQLHGKHNISNALAVIVFCIELNIDLSEIRKYLEEFTGTARRMEVMGKFRGAIIVDDYAHHPTEIKATLAGARELYKDKNIIVVFHPHTFTRTKEFFSDFSKSFTDADEVIVLDIYGSSREKQGGAHSSDLVEKIIEEKSEDGKAKYIPTLEEAENYLRGKAGEGDVIILMGAGDVFRIGEGLVE